MHESLYYKTMKDFQLWMCQSLYEFFKKYIWKGQNKMIFRMATHLVVQIEFQAWMVLRIGADNWDGRGIRMRGFSVEG